MVDPDLDGPSENDNGRTRYIEFSDWGTSWGSLEYFEDRRHRLSEIQRVWLFFYGADAVKLGFERTLSGDHGAEVTDGPSMVLRDAEGSEMWLEGLNCGYGGTGPTYAVRILDAIGFTGVEDLVYRYELLHLHRGTTTPMPPSRLKVEPGPSGPRTPAPSDKSARQTSWWDRLLNRH